MEDASHLPKSMVENTKKEKRARWSSTAAFILAAVGSAVGLGNVWRFPYLVSKHGGAPFLIPYLVCLILVGMPILLMELSLGQMFQGGDIEAFGRMNPRMRGIGLASVFGSFVIVSYYSVILAYAGIYFVHSFKSPLAYAEGLTKDSVTLDTASSFFNDVVVKAGNAEKPTYAMSGEMVLALACIWVLVFLCIFNGVQTAGWVVYVTVPLPILIIVILLIKGATLEGAGDGIKEYIGKWNGSALNSVTMWSDAVGQVFFTLSVCMGVMTAYSSHNTIKHQVGRDEKIISLSDMGIALLGGFTVYSMLGHLEHLTQNKDIYQISSFSLAFVAYPTGISLIGGSNFWGVLFFLCLILLGIDSAFSMVEAVTTVITDSWIAKRYKLGKPICSFVVCLIAFALGTMHTMDIGIFLLDVVDHYVNSWGMIFLGFLESVSVGWVYKSHAQQKKVGKMSVIIYNFFFFFALLIGIIVGLSSSSDAAGGWGVFAGLIVYGIGLLIAVLLADKSVPLKTRIWAIVGWYGPDRLRRMINSTDGPAWVPGSTKSELKAMYMPHMVSIMFSFLIKYFIPAVLWVLFFTTFKTDVTKNYGGIPWSYQVIGFLLFSFMAFLVLTVAVFPRVLIDPSASGGESILHQLKWVFTPSPAKSDITAIYDESEVYDEDRVDTVIANNS